MCQASSPLLGRAIHLGRPIDCVPIGGSGTVHKRHAPADLSYIVLDLGVFSFTPVILGHAREDETVSNSKDEEEPEQIKRLECGQQSGGDKLGQPALVLASRPVQHVGSHGTELGEDGEDDLEVQVVAQVNPDTHKNGKVWALPSAVDVVQGLGGLECVRKQDESA